MLISQRENTGRGSARGETRVSCFVLRRQGQVFSPRHGTPGGRSAWDIAFPLLIRTSHDRPFHSTKQRHLKDLKGLTHCAGVVLVQWDIFVCVCVLPPLVPLKATSLKPGCRPVEGSQPLQMWAFPHLGSFSVGSTLWMTVSLT